VPEFATVSGYINDLVEREPYFKYIGFELANELILDMSPTNDQVRANHKRNSAMFRVSALPKIFSSLVRHLNIIFIESESWDIRSILTSKLLEALSNAMEFDCSSKTKGDVTLLSVPDDSSPHWACLLTVEVPRCLLTIFELCLELQPSISEQCLNLLSLLASIKRSNLAEPERHAFLRQVIQGSLKIVAIPNLDKQGNVMYGFCKLAARLSLAEVIGDMAVYPETLALISELYKLTKSYFSSLSL
jgi:hypothetical protein